MQNHTRITTHQLQTNSDSEKEIIQPNQQQINQVHPTCNSQHQNFLIHQKRNYSASPIYRQMYSNNPTRIQPLP